MIYRKPQEQSGRKAGHGGRCQVGLVLPRRKRHLLETYAEASMGTRLRAKFLFQSSNRAEVIVRRCAAYEGAKRAALPRADQACIACETVWDAWLETLMPHQQVEVQVAARQGKGDAICRFLIQLEAAERDG